MRKRKYIALLLAVAMIVTSFVTTGLASVFAAEGTQFKYGDVDNSGAVDAKDISLVINRYLGDTSVIKEGTNAFRAADVDNSGSVDAKDISLMINRYLGDSTPFPAENSDGNYTAKLTVGAGGTATISAGAVAAQSVEAQEDAFVSTASTTYTQWTIENYEGAKNEDGSWKTAAVDADTSAVCTTPLGDGSECTDFGTALLKNHDVLVDNEDITVTMGLGAGDVDNHWHLKYNTTLDKYVVQGTNNPKDAAGKNSTATVGTNMPVTGSYIVYQPKVDGKLVIRNLLFANKTYIVAEASGMEYDANGLLISGGTADDIVYSETSVESASLTCTVDVSADSTYYVFALGSKIGLQGFTFIPAGVTPPENDPNTVGSDVVKPSPEPSEAPDPNFWKASADLTPDTKDAIGGALTGVSNLTYTADAKTIEKIAFTGKVKGSSNPAWDGTDLTDGSAIKFVAPDDGSFTVYTRVGGSTNEKTFGIYESGVLEALNSKTASGEYVGLSVDVTKGKTYYAFITGSNAEIYGAKFAPGGSAPSPSPSAAPLPSEEPADPNTVKAAAGTTITVNATPDSGYVVDKIEVSGASVTVDSNADKTVSTFTMPAANITVNVTFKDQGSGLPADVLWSADDPAFDAMFNAIADKVPTVETTVNGLTTSAGFYKEAKTVTYTHTNGKSYTFKRQWKHGSADQTLTFTPEQACIVTVVFNGNKALDRVVSISQGETMLASAASTIATTTAAETVVADIEDPTAGDVIISGEGSNKLISAIFVEYYDPTIIVNRKLSGNITYIGSKASDNTKIVFTDTKDGTKYEVPIAATYSLDIRQNRKYDITVETNGVPDEGIAVSLTTNSVSLVKNDKTFDITVADIVETKVEGDVVVHDIFNDGTSLDLNNVVLTFTATDDETLKYTTGISGNKLSALTMLPNHEYAVTATGIDGYELSPLSQSYLMAGGDLTPFKNILFEETFGSYAFKNTVEVGADKEFKTVSDAVTAIEKMSDRPTGEKGRVTVVIDPGTYVEQVIVNPSYVTFAAADPDNMPTITFYYGIGYLYYSAKGGYYDRDLAVQKTAVNTVTRWGSTVRLVGSNFLAENIIFENSLNCRVTDEEIADGVTPAGVGWYGDVSGKPDRTVKDYNPRTKNATERCAAIACDGANFELYKCEFIGSQDTFYTGANGYVKDCYIEGGTDYIFGGNSVVFDGCTLAWHGYSDGAIGGYITACKSSDIPVAGEPNLSANGYLLKNCKVTNSKYYTDNKFDKGQWGRNWGGKNCQVVFDGVTMVGADTPSGWTAMTGTLPDSILFVDNVTDKNGNAVDVSGTAFNPNGTMASKNYTIMEDKAYLGDWKPKHYEGTSVWPEVDPDALNLSIDFTVLSTKTLLTQDEITNKSEVSFGLTADGARVAADSEDAAWTFSDFKYHSDDHGLNPGTVKVAVTGPVKITYGTCAWGGDVTVTDAAGNKVAAFNTNNGTCYHNDKIANVVSAYYNGEATTLTISGGKYVPYAAVKAVDASEIPNEATITFANGTDEFEGILPEKITKNVGKNATIPLNRTMYVEGKTLTGWTDGSKTYNVGSSVTLDADMTLTPVFTANTKTATAAYSVTFDFQRQNGAPTIGWQNRNDIYVSQAVIDGESQDVKIAVDTNNGGKVANGNWTDWAQVNIGTTFTVPVAADSVVTVGDIYTSSGTYTINGVTKTGSNQSETVSAAGTCDIVVGDPSGDYWRTITVTYPAS